MSEARKLTLFPPQWGSGGVGSSVRNFGFGIHPVGVPKDSCKGYKATVIYPPKKSVE